MQFERLGTGPALVLIPGLGCDSRLWEGAAAFLSDRFTLVYPEIWPCGSLGDAAQGIAEIIDELGVAPAGVAGLSMGGYVAFELLRVWPHKVRAAAILDSTPYADTPARAVQRRETLRLLAEGDFERVLSEFLAGALSPRHAAGGPARDLLAAMARDLGSSAYAKSVSAIAGRGFYTDVLPLIRVPVLLLAGELDALTPPEVARRVVTDVPTAHVREIPGAGHLTPLEEPEQVGTLLGTFFDDVFSYRLHPSPSDSLEPDGAPSLPQNTRSPP